jgi:hydrogenase expression/formation protein HypD
MQDEDVNVFSIPGEKVLRDPEFTRKISKQIHKIAKDLNRSIKMMHVCGTHEHVIAEFGLRSLLPPSIEVISGPGCPVCVCPAVDIDRAIAITHKKNVILTTFGDMIRVPSTQLSLAERKAQGGDIRIVYGPADAIEIAKSNKDKEVVFFAIGFETTAPLLAYEMVMDPPSNFSVICAHKTVPPAMDLIVKMPEIEIEGFITPGHVATIIGMQPFETFSRISHYSNVITGFEPNDVMLGIFMLLKQIQLEKPLTINEYSRIVKPEGNQKALGYMSKVYKTVTSSWRGIGQISEGGYQIKEKYQNFDALKKFEVEIPESRDIPPGCSCHLVLVGKIKPHQCGLFGKKCTPINPIGPCMVSNEGTCKIAHNFRDISN